MRLLTTAPNSLEGVREKVKQVLEGFNTKTKTFNGETHYMNAGLLYLDIFRDRRGLLGAIEPMDGVSYSDFGGCGNCSRDIMGQLKRWYDGNQKNG